MLINNRAGEDDPGFSTPDIEQILRGLEKAEIVMNSGLEKGVVKIITGARESFLQEPFGPATDAGKPSRAGYIVDLLADEQGLYVSVAVIVQSAINGFSQYGRAFQAQFLITGTKVLGSYLGIENTAMDQNCFKGHSREVQGHPLPEARIRVADLASGVDLIGKVIRDFQDVDVRGTAYVDVCPMVFTGYRAQPKSYDWKPEGLDQRNLNIARGNVDLARFVSG